MCHLIYIWKIVACDVKQLISLTLTYSRVVFVRIRQWVNLRGHQIFVKLYRLDLFTVLSFHTKLFSDRSMVAMDIMTFIFP